MSSNPLLPCPTWQGESHVLRCSIDHLHINFAVEQWLDMVSQTGWFLAGWLGCHAPPACCHWYNSRPGRTLQAQGCGSSQLHTNSSPGS